MKLLILTVRDAVAADPADDREISINPLHVVTCRRLIPPLTEVRLLNGEVFIAVMGLTDLSDELSRAATAQLP